MLCILRLNHLLKGLRFEVTIYVRKNEAQSTKANHNLMGLGLKAGMLNKATVKGRGNMMYCYGSFRTVIEGGVKGVSLTMVVRVSISIFSFKRPVPLVIAVET